MGFKSACHIDKLRIHEFKSLTPLKKLEKQEKISTINSKLEGN